MSEIEQISRFFEEARVGNEKKKRSKKNPKKKNMKKEQQKKDK